MPASSQQTTASPPLEQVRHAKLPPQCNFNDGVFTGLQSFRYFQAPILARPPGCTYHYGSVVHKAAGPFTSRNEHGLPYTNCDIATCPTRATDTVGLDLV